MMVKVLLPRSEALTADAADALAVAICHAQHRGREGAGRAAGGKITFILCLRLIISLK